MPASPDTEKNDLGILTDHTCPNCELGKMVVFYEKDKAPVHSVVLLSSREQAINFTTGDIQLGYCDTCGFISNILFDASLHDYATDYEATQSYSPTFNAFAKRLAHRLIDDYDLHDKDIIEIGCGQGEFLTMLAEEGPSRGTGFDPAYRDEPIESEARDRLKFIADYYSEKYTDYQADFIVCKMTLEHIDKTAEFISTVRRAIGDREDTIVFFQIPNAEYVMRDLAFWDVYYEHCSYFSAASLKYLFRRSGFKVLAVGTEYDDQYLMIEASPTQIPDGPVAIDPKDLAEIHNLTVEFARKVKPFIQEWRDRINQLKSDGKRIVIWGSGSKGVSFLTTLGITNEIEYCVDINPLKYNKYMAGTGQRIVSPEFLKSYQPDVVIVMNPVYCGEIQADLDKMGVSAIMLTVEGDNE